MTREREEEDDLMLSSSSMAALQEFLREQKLQAESFESKKAEDIKDMEEFKEDWQLSQFWYSNETSHSLAVEALSNTAVTGRIGCISSPSAFLALKKLDIAQRNLTVFEFDQRFNKFAEFCFYDFNSPLDFDPILFNSFDYLIVDPPFLSQECWHKTAQTVKALAAPNAKILICTGQIMTDVIFEELGCTMTSFEPKHKNGLSNEFKSFSNYPAFQ